MRSGRILLALVFAVAARASTAQEATSPSYRLHAGTIGAGGAVGMHATSLAVASAGTALGQPASTGISTGPASGTQLEGGFWFTPEPGSFASSLAVVAVLGGISIDRARHRR